MTYVADGIVRPVMWLDVSDIAEVDVPEKLLENENQRKNVPIILEKRVKQPG